VPIFVIYPGTPAGTRGGTVFEYYSLTRTTGDFFTLPQPAHASDTQTTSLAGHFGLAK
jgi:hypothetical protein